MNLYAQSKFGSADEAFSFHCGLMLRILERQMLQDASTRKLKFDAFISHATEDKDTVVASRCCIDEAGYQNMDG